MKYVILSDTHLGQNGLDGSGCYSLLSNVPGSMVEARKRCDHTMAALAKRVEEFADGDKVTLVGCGDMLDLSLSFTDAALGDLAYLIGHLEPVDHFIYVVGNHDHHIWMQHAEWYHTIAPMEEGGLPFPGNTYTPDIFPEHSHLMSNCITGVLEEQGIERSISIHVAYPSFSVLLGNIEGGTRDNSVLYCTHGHLFEGLYTLISRVLEPILRESLNERVVAAVNLSIIEFIYHLLGEMGYGAGANGIVEAVYEDIEKGKDSLVRKVVDGLVEALMPDGAVWGIPDSWEKRFVKWVIRRIIKDKTKEQGPFASKSRGQKVEDSRKAAKSWIKDMMLDNKKNKMIFVAGHTHRADCHRIEGSDITLYNTGSWLIGPNNDDPDTFVLLVDDSEDLEVKFEKIG